MGTVFVQSRLIVSLYQSSIPAYTSPLYQLIPVLYTSLYQSCIPAYTSPLYQLIPVLYTSLYQSCIPAYTSPLYQLIPVLYIYYRSSVFSWYRFGLRVKVGFLDNRSPVASSRRCPVTCVTQLYNSQVLVSHQQGRDVSSRDVSRRIQTCPGSRRVQSPMVVSHQQGRDVSSRRW